MTKEINNGNIKNKNTKNNTPVCGDNLIPVKSNHRIVIAVVFLAMFVLLALVWSYLISYFNNYKKMICSNWNELQYQNVKETTMFANEWMHKRIDNDGITITQAEKEVVDKFISPVKLLQNGDAFFYNRYYVIYDRKSRTKDFAGLLPKIQEGNESNNINKLAYEIMNSTSGTSWFVWNKNNEKEYVAWDSYSLNGLRWTIGFTTAENELLEFSGYYKQKSIIYIFASLLSLLIFIIWILIALILKAGKKRLIELEKTVEDRTAELQTLNRQLIEEVGKVKHISIHDSLTGVYNRAYFEEFIRSVDRPEYLPISIISGDVNGLKLINDAFGHEAGDTLLKEICNVIKRSCDINDFVARIGGDEFVIVMTKTSEEDAGKKIEKIKEGCNSYIDNLFIKSISLGVSTKNDIDRDIHDVYKHAEDRMYRSKLVESRSIRSSILTTLRKTLKERTFETEEHCRRLKENARRIGEELKLNSNQLDELELLALLHDVGKMSVPDRILKKKGELTPEEKKAMKKHTETGYRIASATPELLSIAEGILHHHERWDGKGYPQKLKGDSIPLDSRIIAVVDAFDIMVYGRNGDTKGILTKQEALEQLKRDAGTLYDPDIVDIFIRLSEENE